MPAIERTNVSEYQRIRALHRWLTPTTRMERPLRYMPEGTRRRIISLLRTLNFKYNRIPPPPLDPKIRHELTAGYRNDILMLQDLIGRDLSHWLQ